MLLPERDLTRAGTKCREGCASDIKIRTAPQRQRSDTHKVPRLRDRCYNSHCATARAIRYTHKVPRRLRELYQNSHRATTRAIRHAQGQERVARAHLGYSQNMARTTKKNITNVLLKSQQLFCRGLQNTAPAMKMSPEHPKCRICHTESSSCPKSKTNDESFTKTRLSTLSKRRPSSPNTVPATQNDLQNHLSF